MDNVRIFVERKKDYRTGCKSLQREINSNLDLQLKELRIINTYDISHIDDEVLEKSLYTVFAEKVTDDVFFELNLEGKKYVAAEFVEPYYDQRSFAANYCIRLIDEKFAGEIKSSMIIILDDDISDKDFELVKNYLLKISDYREKDLTKYFEKHTKSVQAVKEVKGLIDLKEDDLVPYLKENKLAMNRDDLLCVVNYFKEQKRNPNDVELKIIDSYWSDHCRHTTFRTKITDVQIDRSFLSAELEEAYDNYVNVRKDLKRDKKDMTLMDLATIGSKYLRKIGRLKDIEKSDEHNAPSIYVNVDVDGKNEKWLLQFKNETHNHPTEMQPFWGGYGCIGGALRDTLASRAYPYQVLRVSGAGNIYSKYSSTLDGKISQKILSTKAVEGYSAYSNQAGIPTTLAHEFYHDDFVAKRMEVSAILGAIKAEDIKRERPESGDLIFILGGKTGADGIGGATAASVELNNSIVQASKDVQKGNAIVARNLMRLFRRKEFTKLIKRAIDLGAGGLSVALGELSDGCVVDLDKLPVKGDKLGAMELALSESQERLIFVVEKKDVEEITAYIDEEDLSSSEIGYITNDNHLIMKYEGKVVVDLLHSFIESAGAKHNAEAVIAKVEEKNPFIRADEPLVDRVFNTLSSDNVVCQKSLAEMFDSTIGTSTVLMPFGGKYQETEAQVSVQRLPILNGKTKTVSIATYGYNPEISKWSPYHGAMCAIIESVAKIVASGAKYNNIRLSFQEYYEKMTSSLSWGKPFAALLGALKAQLELGLPSITGKDSMSGSFNNLAVPPTLISFAFTTAKDDEIITPEFKSRGHKLYLVRHQELKNFTPNFDELKDNFEFVNHNIRTGKIVSAYAIGYGGLVEALTKMSLGNSVGFYCRVDEKELNRFNYGSILIEVDGKLEVPDELNPNFVRIGRTSHFQFGMINDVKFTLPSIKEANTKKFSKVFKNKDEIKQNDVMSFRPYKKKISLLKNKDEVIAYIPIFPGTNCDYDTMRAFEDAGANVVSKVFRSQSNKEFLNSAKEMAKQIDRSDILVLTGGFSAADEPDGSGKFVANILNYKDVKEAINRLIERKGLILGICNGFQALIKSGLLPFETLGDVKEDYPTLVENDLDKHVSQIVYTKVMTNASPWLHSYKTGEVIATPVSHNDGKFVCSKKMMLDLIKNGQVAFAYTDLSGNMAVDGKFNPSGSSYAVEGLISKDGLILGKMGHNERNVEGLYKNIPGNKCSNIFVNAVNYFKK